ncbi:uncharacterized protein LOC119176042 isoform X4 [Rhipicephalus microplus]|uniref:uncharacterized protein LOC119176042 isoform X4 n=1 Tax=Rhipicephalus microplus TaxID=6941 RepID=UPI003F6AC8DE
MYREEEQGPKSSEELVRIYGYNIRLELMPPRARRWRRYGCGPKKYERSWEDKEASTPRSRSGRSEGARGGRRTRGGSLVENRRFHDEDFPDLHSKPSENTATMQLNRAEVKSSARPAGFKGSDLTGSNSSQQEKWDNTVKGSGMTHWGWGKRPSLPPRAVPDAPPKQQDCDVKEDASLGHRVGRPASQSPVKAVEAPQVSPSTGRSRAIRHLLTEQEQSKREYEALKKFAAKGELQDGDNTDLKRSTATTVTPRGGPVGSSQSEAKPSRYSSLRQRSLAEEDGDFTSTVSTAGEAGTGTDLEGGHGVTADSLDSTGRIEPYSDQEDFDGKIVLHPRLHRGDLDDDSGINNGTRGLEDELEDGLDEEDDDEDCLKGERQQDEGEENDDPFDLQDKVLDFDEEKRYPQYIPKKGAFYQHDDRVVGDEDSSEVPEEKTEDDKGSCRPKKLWHEECVWEHDMYREEEQGPKSSEELVRIYGYDIRSEPMPPRARRWRRYGRGPNKYERSWKDEDASTPQSRSGRSGGARGGRRTRGGSLVENRRFHDEDFPDLHSKPSENTATMQLNRAEVNSSARPAGFKGSDLTGSNSSQQEKWDNTVKGSGMTHWGWGKRPSLPPRAVPDAPPKQQDCDVKEDASLGHRVGRPASQSPVMTVEAPQVSPTAGKSLAIQHLLSKHDQSKKEYEALKKFAAKGELQDGDNTDLKRSTATTVTPRGSPVGSSQSEAKPSRYSSLRQRSLAEEDGDFTSTVSTAGKAGTGTDLEGGHGVTADSLDSTGRIEPYSDQEEFDEEIVLHPRLHRGDLDDDSGINNGTRGLEDELEDGLDKEDDDEDCLKGERQQDEGKENVDLQDKVLDFDEDKRYPQYIPKKGAFYQHDDRVVGDEDSSEVPEEKTEDDTGSCRPKKLWHEECAWEHDMYREEEQGPKSSEELVRIYGYDIRSKPTPPRAPRWRRYGRGPNKYERSWKDEEASTPRSRSGCSGGTRGGRRTRGGSLVENRRFHDEDFPDLHSKPSENTATMQLNRAEVTSSARPAGFKGSDLTGSNSSQQEKWDNTVKGSGMTHWGWGKRPSLPPRAVPDAPPKQQDCDVKEDVPLGHRVSSPAPQSPVVAVEAPQVSPTACRSRAIQHLLSRHDQSKKEYEALKKFAAKGELQDGDNTDLKRNRATTVTPRRGPVGSSQSEAKPSRYSSLRQRSLAEEDGDFTSTVSTAGEGGTGTYLEGGHGVTADSLDSTGRIEPYSDQEDFDGKIVLHPRSHRGDLDDDSGINNGTCGLEDELQDGLDKEDDDEDCLKGERQQDEGKENVDPSDLQDKVLDFDEDKRYPQYIPKKGAFYQHDDHVVGDEDSTEVPEEKTEDDKGSRRPKKLWHEECVWEHDMYREEEQGPKSSEELVRIYGYDIRLELMPLRGRRWRRYGRGPNKYECSWEDKEAYTLRSRSGSGGGARGGRRTRGGSLVENCRFHDEDFPDLHSKPSENTATMQLNRAEVKSSARPAGFKGSDLTGSNSSQQEKWDNTVKGSGMTHWGWGKRPSLPPRAVPDASPKQQDYDVKENVPLGHRVGRPAPQSPVTAVEVPQVSHTAGRSRAIQHLLSKHDQSKREYEALKELAAKGELQGGDNTDLKRSTATTVTSRGGPVGSSLSEAKPSRYSSLQQRSFAEENGDFTSTVSTAGEAGTGTDLEGGHGATADSLDSTGRIEPYSDQEDFDGKIVLHPRLHRGDLDDDSGINNGTRGLEDELEDGLDEEDDDEDCLKGERQQDEGEENVDPSDLQDKVLDFDEDERYPQYIPKKGAFYQHDDRVVGDEDSSEVPEKKTDYDKGSRRPKKLWHEECVWEHDMYREEEQGPKSSEELVRIYGYDIRLELMPPRARRWRRYGRGPNKYERSWENKEAYTLRSRSGRGGGARGGRRTRGVSLVENPQFHNEDFPDLHSKPSENTAAMQLNRAEVKSSAKPAGFKGSDLTGSNSSQQEKWDNTVKGSGTTHWGWRKRPSLPPRAVPDASPKQQDYDVKEDVPLGHRVDRPAPQSPVMAVEVPQVSPTACRSRAIQHLLRKNDQSKREYEALKELAAKGELQGGDSTDLKRSTATTGTSRRGPVRSSESEAKPRRYSSLRKRSPAKENDDPFDLQDKVLDLDEDKRYPQYIPNKGAFYQHDDRVVGDEDSSEVPEEKTEDDKGSLRPKKLWHGEGVWDHDMYREEEQGPKSSEELVRVYGYDIRSEPTPPRARRWRRYGRGPKKYERSWEDEGIYTLRSRSGRGGGARGGRETRGGSLVENPQFHDEDFPDLHSKPSENTATMQLNRAEVKSSAKPAGFKGSDLTGSNSSQQEKWDNTVKGSGMTHWGWGKRPSLPPRAVPDAPPKQQDSNVKEDVPLGHRVSSPAPQSPMMTVEAPQVPPTAGKSQAIQHLLSKHHQSKKEYEALKKFAAKGELQDGDNTDMKRSTATTVTPRGGPVGSSESEAKPSRYSSLRQHCLAEEDGNLSSTVSTAGEGGTGTNLDDGHGVTADSLDSPGGIEPYSDQEDFDGEIVLDPGLHRSDLDDDSGINTGTRGLEDELEECLDEEDDDEDCLKGERQQDEGKENVDPSDLQDKVFDFDEDKRYPQYIPKKGAFYQHDDRVVGDEDSSEVPEEKTEDDTGSLRPKKLWHEEGVWDHDMYSEEEQGPKSSEELVRIYGYDIRSEPTPPRARRWRRYGRGPKIYERSWENEETYTLRSRSGRGGGARGGRETRGGSLVENPQFHDEDFPDLHSKPSENTATMQLNRAEVKSSAKPAGFKGSDLTGSNSSQEKKWDNTVKGSGMTHWGWGKRPSLPPRAVQDAPPKQQDSNVKEDVPLGHRVSSPAPQSPMMTVEAPQVSPSAGKSQPIQHLLSKHDQSKKEYEALKKFAAKGELQDGDNTDLKRSTATTVTPRGGPVESSESEAKPSRYSSLRQRSLAEEDGNLSSTVSTAGEGGTGTDLEDGHGVTADSLDSPGRIEPYSDQEDFDGEIVLDPGLHRGDLNDDSGINTGTRGLEDELEECLDEEDDDEDCLKGERQQDEGKENVDPSDLQDKVLDFDEDKRYPQYIPKKGAFYQHDDRVVGDEDSSEVPEEKTEDDTFLLQKRDPPTE